MKPDTWQSAHTLEQQLNWVAEALDEADLFYGHGTDNAWDEAVFLCLTALNLPLTSSDSVLSLVPTREQKERIQAWTTERIEARKPLPYITGEGWFAGRRYRVTPEVLIPRSPLAEVLSAHAQPWLQHPPRTILDLCTGSGCIGIEAAHQFPEAKVDLVDVSPTALQVAQLNVSDHGVSDRVQCIASDGFAELAGKQYDLILLNPPYVGAEEMADMPPEFNHEPQLALASGQDGLLLTERLLRQAKDFLTPSGVLFLEVGYSADVLQAKYPGFSFIWLEFANGGSGVTVLSQQDCAWFYQSDSDVDQSGCPNCPV